MEHAYSDGEALKSPLANPSQARLATLRPARFLSGLRPEFQVERIEPGVEQLGSCAFEDAATPPCTMQCQTDAWAKPKVKLICGKCDARMLTSDEA